MTVFAAGRILTAHTDTLPTLPGWDAVTVVEGPLLSRGAPTRYCTLGFVPGDDAAEVTFTPEPDAQGNTDESGSIGCGLYVAGADVPTARAALLELLEPWAGWLVKDRTLGGVIRGDSELHLSADLTLGENRNSGGIAAARVTITYTAHVYG